MTMKGDSHCGCACGENDARTLVFDNSSTFHSPVSPPRNLFTTAKDLLKEHLRAPISVDADIGDVLAASPETTSQSQTIHIMEMQPSFMNHDGSGR